MFITIDGIMSFIVIFVTFTIGIFVLLSNIRSSINKKWFLLNTAVSAWGFNYGLMITSLNKTLALWGARFLNLSAVLIVPFYAHFIFILINEEKKHKRIIDLFYLVAFCIFVYGIVFPNSVVLEVAPKFKFTYFTSSIGYLYYFYQIFWSISIGYVLLHLIFKWKDSTGSKKNQLTYVLLSSLVGFSGGATMFFSVFNANIYPIGIIIMPFYPLLIAYAIFKHHLMDIRIAITRFGVFSFVYSLVLGIPFVVGYNTKSWFLPTTLMFILSTAGPLIYNRLRKKAEDILLMKQRAYQRTLLQAAEGMIKIREVNKLVSLIVHIITKSVGVKMAGVFLFNKEREEYVLESYRDRELLKESIFFKEGNIFVEYVKNKHTPFFLSELEDKMKKENYKEYSEVKSILNKIGVFLVVPAQLQNRLLGFMVLGEKKDGQLFSLDDISVFQALSYQASLAIENAQFLDEFRNTQEKIFHADKLATVGAMADGVAHQINNRLQAFLAISGDMGDVVDHIDRNNMSEPALNDLEYCKYCIDKIENNVKHASQIIKGILNYARTEKDTSFRYIDIRDMFNISFDLLRVKHQLKEFVPNVLVHEGEEIPKVWASPAQISEAIFNLIDNGYESIKEKQDRLRQEDKDLTPEIKIEFFKNPASLVVKISDNGLGISDEDKKKIFAPFFTTKSSMISGTGLGMYVVKRIVEENHRGRIWFESDPGQGATFYMELPTTKVDKVIE